MLRTRCLYFLLFEEQAEGRSECMCEGEGLRMCTANVALTDITVVHALCNHSYFPGIQGANAKRKKASGKKGGELTDAPRDRKRKAEGKESAVDTAGKIGVSGDAGAVVTKKKKTSSKAAATPSAAASTKSKKTKTKKSSKGSDK